MNKPARAASAAVPRSYRSRLRRVLAPRVGPDLLQSALSGRRRRHHPQSASRGSAAAERVRAKTGTLNGVSCLSGYVGDQSDLVVFSITAQSPVCAAPR